jgi:hypothetical protein
MVVESRKTCLAAWFAALAAVWLTGCGPGGVRRYDLSGSVTYEGKPIPSGMISFDPVGLNKGGGYAVIVDGKYDTTQHGRGHLGGEHVVHINGDAGKAPAPGSPEADSFVVKPLFAPYETTMDLSKGKAIVDFDVPRNERP